MVVEGIVTIVMEEEGTGMWKEHQKGDVAYGLWMPVVEWWYLRPGSGQREDKHLWGLLDCQGLL